MIRHAARFARRAGLFVVLTAVAAPLAAQKAAYVEDFGQMREKFTSLAGAMESEMYDWRPMEGVRSVSEVYMLIAAEAYFMPSFWDADPPEGIEVSNALFGELAVVTDKADVLMHLERAFEHSASALESLPEDRLGVEIPFFGQERTISEAIYILLADMHEHLGQAIAYARMNQVVPPWSGGG